MKREIFAETSYDIYSISEPVTKTSELWEIAEIKWVKPKEIKKLITTNLDPKVARELDIQ